VPAAESRRMLDPDLRIRRLRESDVTACGVLAADRGWPPEQNKWRLLLGACEAYGIDDPAGGLAATIVLTRYGRQLASVGMMLVASRFGRAGLGRRVLVHALELADPTVVYLAATSYSRALCEDLGFRAIDTVDRHAGRFVPERRAEPLSRVRPVPNCDLSYLAAVDLRVFGADRWPLLTPLFGVAERALVAEDQHGVPVGFAACWRNEQDLVVGPLVGGSTATARSLVAAAAAGVGGPVRVDIRGCHAELARWAISRGLIRCWHATLMVRGGELPGNRDELFAPICGATG
jgi:hypothetical protein